MGNGVSEPDASTGSLSIQSGLSGDVVATVLVQDFEDVKTLKRHLEGLCGVPRFRQKLLHNGVVLEDHASLADLGEVQLILMSTVPDACTEGEMAFAIGRGNVLAVEKMLNRPQEPNPPWRLPPLAQACAFKKIEMVRLLLEARADPHHPIGDVRSFNALHVASVAGDLNVTSLLLSARADPWRSDDLGYTPLSMLRRISQDRRDKQIEMQGLLKEAMVPNPKPPCVADQAHNDSAGSTTEPVVN